ISVLSLSSVGQAFSRYHARRCGWDGATSIAIRMNPPTRATRPTINLSIALSPFGSRSDLLINAFNHESFGDSCRAPCAEPLTLELAEAHRHYPPHFQIAVSFLLDHREPLILSRSQRHHQASTWLELRDQRGRDFLGTCGNENFVVRRMLGPPARPVAN